MTSRKSLDDKLKGMLQKEHPLADISPDAISKALKRLNELMAKQAYPKKGPGKAIGGPIENPLDKKQNPLYREELGMYGGGVVRKKVYARGGSTRSVRSS